MGNFLDWLRSSRTRTSTDGTEPLLPVIASDHKKEMIAASKAVATIIEQLFGERWMKTPGLKQFHQWGGESQSEILATRALAPLVKIYEVECQAGETLTGDKEKMEVIISRFKAWDGDTVPHPGYEGQSSLNRFKSLSTPENVELLKTFLEKMDSLTKLCRENPAEAKRASRGYFGIILEYRHVYTYQRVLIAAIAMSKVEPGMTPINHPRA